MAIIEQDVNRLKRMLTTSSTATSFAAKIPTTTEPTNDGVHLLGQLQGPGPRWLWCCFFGAGAENVTFDVKLIGWRKGTTLWVPSPIWTGSCTVGTAVGIAGATSDAVATDRFADTIASTSGTATADVYSPADNRIAWVSLECKGYAKIEFIYDMTGATNGNGLFTVY